MVGDKRLRYYTSPVCHIGIISECEDAGCRKFRWEEGFGPRFLGAWSSPRCIAITGQTVDKDDTGEKYQQSFFLISGGLILNRPILWLPEQFETVGEGLFWLAFGCIVLIFGSRPQSPEESLCPGYVQDHSVLPRSSELLS